MQILLILQIVNQMLNIALSHGAHPTQIANHLTYTESTCSLDGMSIELHEVQLKPGKNLEMRVLPNPDAYVNSKCYGNYGGPGLAALMRRSGNTKVLAATNGNFFRTQKKSKTKTGFVPTGMLWSKAPTHGSKTYEKLRLKGGKDLLLVDHQGAHRLRLKLESCGNQTCATLDQSLESGRGKHFSKNMNTDQLLKAIRSAFPSVTLISQLTMDLSSGKVGKDGKLEHFSECPTRSSDQNTTVDDDRKSFWKCRKLPRTVFCGKRDGTVSLMIAPSAYVYDLARGLRIGGACATECEILFNLDGGGSTQMGFRNPQSKKFQILGLSDDMTSNCDVLRPVDHYFAIVSK